MAVVGNGRWLLSSYPAAQGAFNPAEGEAPAIEAAIGRPAENLHSYPSVFTRGARYEATSVSLSAMREARNSFVQYKGPNGTIHAGCIRRIISAEPLCDGFHETLDDVFLVVQPFEDLPEADVSRDPFQRWPALGGRTKYARLRDEPQIISISNLISHVAVYSWERRAHTFSEDVVAIWSLDRVSPFLGTRL